jgi:2-amino-4-hydroxy-6-hydroxymethyldihydropteridine diphosphokinase
VKKQDTSENQVNSVYLAFGSNLGDRNKNLNKALSLLKKENIVVKKKSNLYRSKSWPNENFPEFINFVLFIETRLNLKKLFLKIKKVERQVGRIKSKRNFPRVCDIDIIDFNGQIIQKKIGNNKINVPHERMHSRNFVLLPLFEINKDWFHPKLCKNIVFLLSNLSSEQLLGIKIVQ